MGNWELAVWPLLVANANPGAIYRAFDNPYVDRYLSAKRRALYPGGLFGRKGAGVKPIDDLNLAQRLLDHVRRGGRLGIICDQYYRRGVPVPFFGRMTVAQPPSWRDAPVRASGWLAACGSVPAVASGSRSRSSEYRARPMRLRTCDRPCRKCTANLKAGFATHRPVDVELQDLAMILRGALVAGKPGSGPRPQAFDLPKPPRIGYNAAREPDLAAALACPGQCRCAGANREPPMLGRSRLRGKSCRNA
jgi:hypothetical protein